MIKGVFVIISAIPRFFWTALESFDATTDRRHPDSSRFLLRHNGEPRSGNHYRSDPGRRIPTATARVRPAPQKPCHLCWYDSLIRDEFLRTAKKSCGPVLGAGSDVERIGADGLVLLALGVLARQRRFFRTFAASAHALLQLFPPRIQPSLATGFGCLALFVV